MRTIQSENSDWLPIKTTAAAFRRFVAARSMTSLWTASFFMQPPGAAFQHDPSHAIHGCTAPPLISRGFIGAADSILSILRFPEKRMCRLSDYLVPPVATGGAHDLCGSRCF